MTEILDSGNRRKFNSGAVRDIDEGKGRCDLMPIGIIADTLDYFEANRVDLEGRGMPTDATILHDIDQFIQTTDTQYLFNAIIDFTCISTLNSFSYSSFASEMLDLALHYEQGCLKYGERNWEKGIPLHCYIDSGVRHFLKYIRNDDDERHDRAFLWNMLGAIWTYKNKPNCIDISPRDRDRAPVVVYPSEGRKTTLDN